MHFLPCIRVDSDRWWLPLSPAATEAIGGVMLRFRDGRSVISESVSSDATQSGSGHGDPSVRRLHHQLRQDPSLWIYTAVAMSSSGTTSTGTSSLNTMDVTPWQMTQWLARNSVGRFASGEAFMSAPTVTAEVLSRWDQLADYFRTLPRRQWLSEASLWLELLGPPVPEAWRRSWPTVIEDSDAFVPQGGAGPQDGEGQQEQRSTSMLQKLARRQQRQQSLEVSFGKRLAKDKLAAIKQFAYGLSHEINNPLANISTRAQQLQRTEPDPAKHATLQRIIDQVYRAHEMIADLMFYANPPDPQPVSVDLVSVVREVVEQFDEEATRQSIRIELQLPDYEVTARADPTMFGEAIRVLIRNAIDAIGCQGTIVASLIVEPNGLIASDASRGVARPTPRSVTVHIADSGPGVSQEAREHAFDPYYSGREAGRGLGVGLCRAYRVIQMHHGRIALVGGPAGCVATITLPVT